MKIASKIAALMALVTSSAAFAAGPAQLVDACCALGVCCGMGCC